MVRSHDEIQYVLAIRFDSLWGERNFILNKLFCLPKPPQDPKLLKLWYSSFLGEFRFVGPHRYLYWENYFCP